MIFATVFAFELQTQDFESFSVRVRFETSFAVIALYTDVCCLCVSTHSQHNFEPFFVVTLATQKNIYGARSFDLFNCTFFIQSFYSEYFFRKQ